MPRSMALRSEMRYDAPKPKLGNGERFRDLKNRLSKEKGVTNPGGLAAVIGAKKYGQKKMTAMASAGKRKGC